MGEVSRGEFLGIGAMLAAGFGVGGWELSASERRAKKTFGSRQVAGGSAPDLVVLNGRVYTMDDAMPRAEAFAVKDGRFVAVGGSDDIRNLVAQGTEVIDAGGMTVTPGFIDAHMHPASGGIRELTQVNLDVRSMAEIGERLRAAAAERRAGEWIVAFKYDDTKRSGTVDGSHVRTSTAGFPTIPCGWPTGAVTSTGTTAEPSSSPV